MLDHCGAVVALVEASARRPVSRRGRHHRRDRGGRRLRGRQRVGRALRPRPRVLPGPPRSRRPRRHPLHLGDDGPPQGGRRPPRQLVTGPLPDTAVERWGLDPRQPPVHLRRPVLRVHADEARAARHLPPALRRRHLARHRRVGPARLRLPGARHGHPPPRPPALRHRRPQLDRAVHGGQRPPRPPRARAPPGQAARRAGVQQLRHDRGRLRLLPHAAGRGRQAPGLGGQAAAPGRDRLRGRRR